MKQLKKKTFPSHSNSRYAVQRMHIAWFTSRSGIQREQMEQYDTNFGKTIKLTFYSDLGKWNKISTTRH